MTVETFYEQIDIVFDRLYEKYGLTDELIQHKQDLLEIYDKENEYRCKHIMDKLKVRHFYIDENGYVKSV